MATTTGNSYPLELQQIASKFQRQIRDFRPWRARIKCRQVIATMTDNRKWQCGPKTGNTYVSGTMTDRMTIPTANLGLSTTPSAKKLTQGDCDNDRQPEMAIYRYGAPILQFLVVDSCPNHLANLFIELVIIEDPEFGVGI